MNLKNILGLQGVSNYLEKKSLKKIRYISWFILSLLILTIIGFVYDVLILYFQASSSDNFSTLEIIMEAVFLLPQFMRQ